MARTKALPGKSLTTSLQTLVTNTSADAKVRTYEVRFSNIDGTNTAAVSQCIRIDSANSNAQIPMLPINVPVKALDGLKTNITLNPGDSIQASASAAGDIYAAITQIHEEAA